MMNNQEREEKNDQKCGQKGKTSIKNAWVHMLRPRNPRFFGIIFSFLIEIFAIRFGV